VLVYSHRSFPLDLPGFLEEFERRVRDLHTPTHDQIVSLLVEFGEAESAFADALLTERDEEREELGPWRAAGREVANAFCASARRDADRLDAALVRLGASAAALRRTRLLSVIDARTAEGFACYGLHPEQYMAAADRMAAELKPDFVYCIGLRSIGSVLAQVVASALETGGVKADVRTVRPRGHPYDRRIVMDRSLGQAIASSGASHVAIVDEGPGLSGSSFAAAAEALLALGFAADRIVLMPSWNAAAEGLRSERARRVWLTHRKIAVEADRCASFAPGHLDLSAGRWRSHVLGRHAPSWPAVQPQHERLKYLTAGGDRSTVWRFAGLGRYGEAKLARAAAIAEAGFGPAPIALRGGFLGLQWVEGTVLATAAEPVLPEAVVDRLADYAAFTRHSFLLDGTDDVAELHGMMIVNIREGLGEEYVRAADAMAAAARPFTEPRVAVDGRLLTYEWIRSPSGLLKVDALDHHADDFFPGCRDIAWDLAGAIAEFDLPSDAAEALLTRYARTSGDTTIARRLPFYLAAYLAYRVGYTSLAAQTLGETCDGRRFTQWQSRYRRLLARLLRRQHATRRC
jgi:hypothetical protein